MAKSTATRLGWRSRVRPAAWGEPSLNFISEQLSGAAVAEIHVERADSRQCHTRGPGFSHKILKRHCVPRVESHATDASARGERQPRSSKLERSRDGLSRLRCSGKVDVPRPEDQNSPGISPCPIVEITLSLCSSLPTHERQTGGECQLSDSESRATISRVPVSNVFCGLLISRRLCQPSKRVQESSGWFLLRRRFCFMEDHRGRGDSFAAIEVGSFGIFAVGSSICYFYGW